MNEHTTQTEIHASQSTRRTARQIVTVVFTIIEVIFAFRFLFKLFGANASNGFVQGLYAITQPIVGIFEGIFGKPSMNGSVLEPATLIAMVIIALVFWGILSLMNTSSSHHVEKSETDQNVNNQNPNSQTYNQNPNNQNFNNQNPNNQNLNNQNPNNQNNDNQNMNRRV